MKKYDYQCDTTMTIN